MATTLHDLTSTTASVSIPVGQDTVTLVYYPGRITDDDMVTLAALSSDTMKDMLDAVNELLARLIKSWDVFQDEDTTAMLPIELATFRTLPVIVKTLLLSGLVKDFSAKPSDLPPLPIRYIN